MLPSSAKAMGFLRDGSDFSEEPIKKNWGKESANESDSKNGDYEIGSQSDNMVGSPHGFVINGIEVLKGNEKVAEVIDVDNWRVDNSRLLRVLSGSGTCVGNRGGALAQTRFERVLEKPNEPPLSEGHTSGSEEGIMEHTFELMDTVPPIPHDSHLSGGNIPGSDEGRMELI
ncbi:hypothetical protein Tco_0079865 [Tanacetum coccineum]